MRATRSTKSKPTGRRTDSINIRTTTRMRSLIDRAASFQGRTRSDFMLEAAHRAAVDTLLDQTFFQIDAAAYKEFSAALDRSTTDNEKLRALLRTPAPWDKS